MKISKVVKEDFDEISCLVKEEFPYTKKKMNSVERRIKDGSIIFTAQENNFFLGFIEFKVISSSAKLLGLAVKKEFRKKGAGKKLFDFLIDYSKKNNLKKIFLLVKEDNLKAKKLYKSKNFIKTGFLQKKIEGSKIEKRELNLTPFKGLS